MREPRVGDVYVCNGTGDKRVGRTVTVKATGMYRAMCESFNPSTNLRRKVHILNSHFDTYRYSLKTAGPSTESRSDCLDASDVQQQDAEH